MGNPPPFYQEVIDALAGGNDPGLTLLRDLCVAVEGEQQSVASPLVARLEKLKPRDPPIGKLSAALFHELMTRMLLAGWPRELTHLLDWYVPAKIAAGADAALIANWAGIVAQLVEPSPSRELDRIFSKLVRCRDALKIALAHLGAVNATPQAPPKPSPDNFRKPPPAPPAAPPPTLETQLVAAVEHLARRFEMLEQQVLAIAIAQLEYDRSNDIMRRLQRLHIQMAEILAAQEGFPDDRARRAIALPVRVMEIRPRKRPADPHLFVDAFTPHTARSVGFTLFNRLDDNPPQDWRAPLGLLHMMRRHQLAFWLDVYGEPEMPGTPPSAGNLRRRTLIKESFRDQMKLQSDDDLVAFLVALFETTVRERMAAPFDMTEDEARQAAWATVTKFVDRYLDRVTAHTKHNVAEGPKSYLEQEFPRAINGNLIHDCGVYATRMAYILLSMAERVDRIHKHCFDMKASWILLPLHVGLLVQSNFAVLIVHNQALFHLDDDLRDRLSDAWDTIPPGDRDPADEVERELKFLEDVAAAAFNPNVDMPLVRMDLPRGPVTKRAIWDSYRRLLRRERLFTALIANRSAPEFQFDLYFIGATTLQRKWFNRDLVRFWNERSRGVWQSMQKDLSDRFADARDKYVAALEDEVKLVADAYGQDILPGKAKVSLALRDRQRRIVQSDVRVVFSERLKLAALELGPVGAVRDHIEDIKARDPAEKAPLQPPLFALDEELLSIIPE